MWKFVKTKRKESYTSASLSRSSSSARSVFELQEIPSTSSSCDGNECSKVCPSIASLSGGYVSYLDQSLGTWDSDGSISASLSNHIRPSTSIPERQPKHISLSTPGSRDGKYGSRGSPTTYCFKHSPSESGFSESTVRCAKENPRTSSSCDGTVRWAKERPSSSKPFEVTLAYEPKENPSTSRSIDGRACKAKESPSTSSSTDGLVWSHKDGLSTSSSTADSASRLWDTLSTSSSRGGSVFNSSSGNLHLHMSSLGSSSQKLDVTELYQAGIPDHEVLWAWLKNLRLDKYYQNFMDAGYDMPTITYMTPQDLTAIGISKPRHRMKLSAEIGDLNICDGIPQFIPSNVLNWLRMLGLEKYYCDLAKDGYVNIKDVTKITWEDLEDIGITKLGHMKRIMLGINRLRRIQLAKSHVTTIHTLDAPVSYKASESPTASGINWTSEQSPQIPPSRIHYDKLPYYWRPKRSICEDRLLENTMSTRRSNLNKFPLMTTDAEYERASRMQVKQHPTIVPIRVRRMGSLFAPYLNRAENPYERSRVVCRSFLEPYVINSNKSDCGLSSSTMTVASASPIDPKPVLQMADTLEHSNRSTYTLAAEIHEENEQETDNDQNPLGRRLERSAHQQPPWGSLEMPSIRSVTHTTQLGPPQTCRYQLPAVEPPFYPNPQGKTSGYVAEQKNSGNILGEIDDMLQGLSNDLDQLDIML